MNALLKALVAVSVAMGIVSAGQASASKPVESGRLLPIHSPAIPRNPWTVAGEFGGLFGRQDGSFEAWQYPVKLISHLRITAEVAEYPVPIDVNANAAEIEVTPAETTITYSHSAFTVRQRMLAARGTAQPPDAGTVVTFQVLSSRPIDLTFSFTPEMLRMWPAPNFGIPSAEWISAGSLGGYVLHTDNPAFSSLVGMRGAKPGVLVPYQEHPQTFPLQLKIHYDPAHDVNQSFVLLMALRDNRKPTEQLEGLESAVEKIHSQTTQYYSDFFDKRLTIQTPNESLDQAVRWAEIAIDQMQVRYKGETGMVAGYYESADSARPGYAWFFGRDTLWTTYAINSYGDFDLTRRSLDFLLHRQRQDGKIMHEFSQSADALDWNATPYFYASADSTPLLIMAMWDYVRLSGDTEYLKTNWEAIQKAWRFTRSHDSDHDGIYENTEGTGWVESWPPGMPHQEIYLAALDEQCAIALFRLASLLSDSQLASEAQDVSARIRRTIESEYYEPESRAYAFSRNSNGTLDSTATIYPSVAWWDGSYELKNAGAMLSRWASSEFSTDWGTRDISDQTSFYDPISYHQGSVWPLFTGWVSLAEYRAGRSLSAYSHLMQTAELTWAQDPGSVAELLSGEFFQPLGRSSSHQMWSSAAILTPLLRGLFGLNWNAATHMLSVNPHLPATWDHALIHNLRMGDLWIDLEFRRVAGNLLLTAHTANPAVLCLSESADIIGPCKSAAQLQHSLTIPLKSVELSLPTELPLPGSVTGQVKVLNEQYSSRSATFTLAAPGGTSLRVPVRFNRSNVKLQTGSLKGNEIELKFPDSPQYSQVSLEFVW